MGARSGLGPTIHVLAMSAGEAGNRVDARVTPGLGPTDRHKRSPGARTATSVAIQKLSMAGCIAQTRATDESS